MNKITVEAFVTGLKSTLDAEDIPEMQQQSMSQQLWDATQQVRSYKANEKTEDDKRNDLAKFKQIIAALKDCIPPIESAIHLVSSWHGEEGMEFLDPAN